MLGNHSKEARIVEAATKLFSERGVRATSMEAIAREAGVAKATAYAYFPDKTHVFRAVCARVAAEITAGVELALADETDLVAALTGALVAKYGLVYDLVHASPQAAELLASSDREARALFERTDALVKKRLEARLRAADRSKQIRLGVRVVGQLAQLLMASADGISTHGRSSKEVSAQIRGLVELVVAGLRPKR